MDCSRDGRHERIWIGLRMDKDPAASDFLFEWMIDRHHGLRIDAFVVDIGHHPHDAPRLRADVDELHDGIGPHQMAIERILPWKQLFGDAAADDHDAFRTITIRLVEIAPGGEGYSKRRKASNPMVIF